MDNTEKDKFEKEFGKMECAFQCGDFAYGLVCLLASSRGGLGSTSNNCACRKEICPLFIMMNTKKKQDTKEDKSKGEGK